MKIESCCSKENRKQKRSNTVQPLGLERELFVEKHFLLQRRTQKNNCFCLLVDAGAKQFLNFF